MRHWSDKMRALLKSNKKHDIIIVKGGATDVSLGWALSDFVKGSKKSDMLTITIIEALPTILSGWDERLVEKVNEVLLKKRNKNKNKLCSYQGWKW